jgi:hypothetical protein
MPARLSPRTRRTLWRGGPLVTGLLASAAVAVPADAAVTAGRQLEIWPGIEMGVVDGYGPNDVLVEVFRGGTLIASKTLDGGGGEMAHGGGPDCWEGAPAGMSVDIKGGDQVVATRLDALGAPLPETPDSFFVRDIRMDELTPGIITGTAFGVQDGAGFDLTAPMTGERVEAQRRNDAGRFDGGGPVDTNGNFSFPLAGDGGAVAGDFIGDDGGNTVTETGGEGASACGNRATTALSTASHSVINIGNVGQDLVVGGPRLAPTNVGQVAFGDKSYPAENTGSTWSATIPAADLAALPNNANHELIATISDGSPNERRVIRKDVTAPVLASSVAPGTYQSTQHLALSSDGGETVRYTTDGSDPRDGSRAYDGIPITLGPGSHTIKAMSIDSVGNRSDQTFTYEIAPPAAPAPAQQPAPQQVIFQTVLQPSRSLTVSRLRASRRIKSRTARRNGVRVAMTLRRGTRVLQLSVYRRVNGRRRLVGQLIRRPSGGGAYVARLRSAKLRRALKPGLYEVVATPGTSVSSLNAAEADTVRFRVVR